MPAEQLKQIFFYVQHIFESYAHNYKFLIVWNPPVIILYQPVDKCLRHLFKNSENLWKVFIFSPPGKEMGNDSEPGSEEGVQVRKYFLSGQLVSNFIVDDFHIWTGGEG